MRKPKISTTESESDPKSKIKAPQGCFLASTEQPCSHAKKFTFNANNSPEAENSPYSTTNHLNNENNVASLHETLIKQANSPSKVRTAYTLTVLSTPSPQFSPNDLHDTGLCMSYVQNISRSCPSLLASACESDKLMQESFTDQGFSTCSADINSPTKINVKSNFNLTSADKMTAVRAQYLTQAGLERIVSNWKQRVAKDERNTTPSSLMQSSSLSSETNGQTCCPHMDLNVTILATSQYWISSGDFTAAITIHYYDMDRLMLLNNIFTQKSFKAIEKNFGIDEKKFHLDSSGCLDQLIKHLPRKRNCSQYWFSTGDIVMPFAGPHMTSEKIQKFFNYIQAFMHETESLRFGIDGYEFSDIYQRMGKSSTPIKSSPWTQIITAPFKANDSDQSDLDLDLTGSSLKRILRKLTTNEKFFTTPEMLKMSGIRYQAMETTAV